MFPRGCSTVIFLAVFLSPAGASAQQEYGSIAGQVTDPSGAGVPAAQVLVKNQSTGASFTARTDAAGFYRAPQLTPGLFTLSVGAAGFNTVVNVEVRVADHLRVDLALQVGAVLLLIANITDNMHLPEDPCKYAVEATKIGPDETKQHYAPSGPSVARSSPETASRLLGMAAW